MTQFVSVIDVTLRDGLQNEPKLVSTADKITLLEKLVAAGITRVQATSFVHPKLVPQMADAEAVAAELHRFPGVEFSALIPNAKGYERAVGAGFKNLDFVMAASDSFNRKNINCSITESLEILDEVGCAAQRDGIQLRIGLATSFHCPFEGTTPPSALLKVARMVRERGHWPIALSDTDGMAFPDQVNEAVRALGDELGVAPKEIVLHFHDTYGRALENTRAGLEVGVRAFDASTGGVGGCPFCPGATGNVATEALVEFLSRGYDTGIDPARLLDAARFANGLSSRHSGVVDQLRR